MPISHKLRPMMTAACLASAGQLHAAIPTGAENAVPLKAGDAAPAVIVTAVDGSSFDLGRAIAAKPTILIFYRGGWCPFCNRQLSGIQDYEQKFLDLGYQILAVGTDRPETLRATMTKDRLSYTLLSDRSMVAASAFRVAYRVAGDLRRNTRPIISICRKSQESRAAAGFRCPPYS